MADYKELLRRAIAALPENNGAARRAVYEKARAALVGQLRAITPPLPARDITQHRLQLEDCIRQVEQEASEAVISLGRSEPGSAPQRKPEPAAKPKAQEPAPPKAEEAAPKPKTEPAEAEAPRPTPAEAEAPKSEPPKSEPPKSEPPKAKPKPLPVFAGAPGKPDKPAAGQPAPAEAPPEPDSIADIIAAEERAESAAQGAPDSQPEPEPPLAAEPPAPPQPEPAKQGFRLFPALAARNESKPASPPSRPAAEPALRVAASKTTEPVAVATAPVAGRIEPSLGNQAVARKAEPETIGVIEETPVEAALSTVREVEVEPVPASDDAREAEGAIERAIETLDRAARGETGPEEAEDAAPPPRAPLLRATDDTTELEPLPRRRSGSGMTIFLVVFALLLAGVGGAGFWAWREGYVDLDQMFGRSTATATPAVPVVPAETEPSGPTLDVGALTPSEEEGAPGNTTTETALAEPTTALEGIVDEERLEPTPELPPEPAQLSPLVGQPGEERLPNAETETALAEDPLASVDPAVLAGSQSLLLEASDDGRGGAVPFSGTVEWSRGVDEIGLPTLVANADIPARNLAVELTIRRNADPSLPASHLMEVDFNVPDSFVGGAISSLPGVLLKDEELVQGTPLVGASARVIGNSFLFALSASERDAAINRELLANRKWMDLAVIYATGRRAIITLEKDPEAETLFTEVFAAWQAADAQ